MFWYILNTFYLCLQSFWGSNIFSYVITFPPTFFRSREGLELLQISICCNVLFPNNGCHGADKVTMLLIKPHRAVGGRIQPVYTACHLHAAESVGLHIQKRLKGRYYPLHSLSVFTTPHDGSGVSTNGGGKDGNKHMSNSKMQVNGWSFLL